MIHKLIKRQFATSIKTSYKTCKPFYGLEAREKILSGIKLLNKTTQATLGPKGRNVLLEYEVGAPRITKDGVTVARSIQFEDHFKELGAQLIRQATANTNLYAGDGTTTSTLLTTTIIEEGMKYLQYGVNPIEMKRGIDRARDQIIEFLEEIKVEVDQQDKQSLENLAQVSTNYDPLLSKLVVDTLHEVGHEGMVEIEQGNSLETELYFTNGVGIARPYASIEFVKDKSRHEVEMNYPLIVVANTNIDKIKKIVPVLEIAKKYQKQLFIIAKDISNDVMSNLVFNHKNGQIEICAITMPGMGDFTKLVLEDLALMTGSTMADDASNTYLEDFTIDQLGKAHRVTVTGQETYIQGGKGNERHIQERMDQLRSEIQKADKEQSKKILKDRLGRLSGKMAILMIGGANEYEIMETRDKLIDALNAVKMGMKYGLLPGGGTSLLRASTILDFVEYENYDQKCGIDILREALVAPIKQLQKNYEMNGQEVIDNLLNKYNENINTGFNLNSDKYEDMIEAGIVDSFPVTKSALIDGISTGSMVLTTEVALIKDKKYKPPKLDTYKKDLF